MNAETIKQASVISEATKEIHAFYGNTINGVFLASTNIALCGEKANCTVPFVLKKNPYGKVCCICLSLFNNRELAGV